MKSTVFKKHHPTKNNRSIGFLILLIALITTAVCIVISFGNNFVKFINAKETIAQNPYVDGIKPWKIQADSLMFFPETKEFGYTPKKRPFYHGSLGKATSFHLALIDLGLSKQESSNIEKSLSGLLDFHRCKPEHTIVFERNLQGQLERFEYHDKKKSYLLIDYRQKPRKASRITLPVKTHLVTQEGTIQSSLGAAIDKAHLYPRVTHLFVKLFNKNIDFSRDVRTGDRFRVLIEKETLYEDFFGFGSIQAIEYISEKKGTLRAFYYKPNNDTQLAGWFNEKGQRINGSWLYPPCEFTRISSRFSWNRKHPILKKRIPHLGVDFVAPIGTPIVASADGIVTLAGKKGNNGNIVVIRHARNFKTSYAHLRHIHKKIRRGKYVKRGQMIGTIGTTGRTTGPHLHFGLKKNGTYIDPLKVLNESGSLLSSKLMKKFNVQKQAMLVLLSKEQPQEELLFSPPLLAHISKHIHQKNSILVPICQEDVP